eukprot:SAG22_NODE_20822_length_262_cov_0.944785_1_plen_52_part_01
MVVAFGLILGCWQCAAAAKGAAVLWHSKVACREGGTDRTGADRAASIQDRHA